MVVAPDTAAAVCPRIAVIGPAPPPNGGMAMQTAQLIELLRGEGCDARFVAVNPPYRPAWLGRVRGVRALARLLPYLAHLWRAAGEAEVIHLMANSGWSWHLFAAPAILVARLRRTPVIVNYRGGEAEAFLRAQARWVLPVMRRAACIVVPSGFLRAVFRRWGIESRIIPNIVRLERFAVEGERQPGEEPLIVVTRNLERIYGVDIALRAFSRLREKWPGARLLIAGEGPEREALEALARELGVADVTRFTGRLGREEMVDLYRRADLLLNASRVDNTPNSLIEAMAAGVAIVSTRAGGIPYLVEDGRDALLCEIDDADCLAASMDRLLREPALCQRLVAAGRETVAAFGWGRVRGQWLDLYRRVASASE